MALKTGKLSYSSAVDRRRITIAAGTSQSDPFDVEGYVMFGLLMPTGWTAAKVSFLVATSTGTTFLPVYDDTGLEVRVTVTPNRAIAVVGAAADALTPWSIMKLRSGTATAAVNQATGREITVRLKA